MNLKEINSIYFLGIGGIGMSALARYFLWVGKKVSGYDKTSTQLTQELEKEGIDIHYEDNPLLIAKEVDLIIYTPAIPATDKEFVFLKNSGKPMLKRAEVLGLISREVPTIAIAGTHGKTTITTMIAHIMHTAGVECSAFMGGISTNLNSNFLASENPSWIVAEADEYDRSFLHLHPEIALISSMDADHLDVYSSLNNMEDSFIQFVKKLRTGGALLVHNSLSNLSGLQQNSYTYGLNPPASFVATDIMMKDGKFSWNLLSDSVTTAMSLAMPGKHNLENALAAVGVCLLAGVNVEHIKNGLLTYKGVKRRFEVLVNNSRKVYIDDYAHHPKELKACINSARGMFPQKKITGIFQPHLFTRTRDFAEGFAQALELLDQAAVMDIYPARERPIEGINAWYILDKMKHENKKYLSDTEVLDFVKEDTSEVLLTMGAGNIDRFVDPIKKIVELC